jgi:hypothetical protein
MFSLRRKNEIQAEIAELRAELAELNDKTPLYKALRAAFGEMEWEQHVIDGYVTSEEGPGDYRPDIRFMMCFELHETLVEWVVNVTGRHSDFDVRLRIKFDKHDDRRYEEIDEEDVDRLNEVNYLDYDIVKVILDTGLPDDISFIWNH